MAGAFWAASSRTLLLCMLALTTLMIVGAAKPQRRGQAASAAYRKAQARLAASGNTGGVLTAPQGSRLVSSVRTPAASGGASGAAAAAIAPPAPCSQAAAAAMCVGKGAVDKFYPDPKANCTCFYRCGCAQGCPALYTCAPGLKFSFVNQYCDWAANVPNCGGDFRVPVPSPSPVPKPLPKPVPKPAPKPVPKPLPLPPFKPAPPGRFRIAGYYESWTDPWVGDALSSALTTLPPYINVINLAFMWPEATYPGGLTWEGTGLSFSSDPAVVRGAIAILKRRNPATRVLISVGGATYTNWDRLNATAIANFVKFFGLDGVDVDYEGGATCSRTAARTMQCSSDAGYIQAVRALRAVLPRPRYLVTTAAWSIGAYGEGRFANSLPAGDHTGMSLNMLRAVGKLLDWIFVMSYDAGSKTTPAGAPTGYDPKEALDAYCTVFPCNRVFGGMQVPPEAWGDAVITVPAAEDFSRYAARRGAAGMMLWSLTKEGVPSAAQLSAAACRGLGMTGCARLLRI